MPYWFHLVCKPIITLFGLNQFIQVQSFSLNHLVSKRTFILNVNLSGNTLILFNDVIETFITKFTFNFYTILSLWQNQFWIKTLDANDKHEVILLLKSRTTFVNVPSVNPFETKVKIDPGKRTTKIFKKWKFQNVLIAHFRNVYQFKLRITWWKLEKVLGDKLY